MAQLESAPDIDHSVNRLLRRAGARYRFPTPVAEIVAAQQLHVTTQDASPLAPTVMASAPAALQEVMRRLQYKILGVLDRHERYVHVDHTSLEVQRRFSTCHEVGHDLCPWHNAPYYVDGSEQLAPDVRATFEREANYAATGILFQQSIFSEVASGLPVGAAAVLQLAAQFGASIHATFWHYVETSLETLLGFILNSTPIGDDTASYRFRVKNTLASASCAAAFPVLDIASAYLSTQDHPDLRSAWETLCASGLPSAGEMYLTARDGNTYLVTFEIFSNSYNLFLIAFNPRALAAKPDRRLWIP